MRLLVFAFVSWFVAVCVCVRAARRLLSRRCRSLLCALYVVCILLNGTGYGRGLHYPIHGEIVNEVDHKCPEGLRERDSFSLLTILVCVRNPCLMIFGFSMGLITEDRTGKVVNEALVQAWHRAAPG